MDLGAIDHGSLPTEAISAAAVAAPAPGIAGIRGRLHLPDSNVVGRKDELEELGQLVRPGLLVTITGPGGCGKSRLASEFAAAAGLRFEEVHVIDFISVDSGVGLIRHVSEIIGIADRDDGAGPTLLQELRRNRWLVVLDGCEHLIEAAARFAAQVVAECPEIALIATSRHRLQIDSEHVFRLEPLAVPSARWKPGDGRPPAAVELFLDRACAISTGYAPSFVEMEAVGEVCRRLDGLPLALEIAAPHVRIMSAAEILTRLRERRTLLQRSAAAAPQHHQSLHALVAWSYDLLEPGERNALLSLSTLTDEFTLGMAEAVIGDVDSDPLRLLAGLVDHSLVMVMKDDTRSTRYRLLDTIRDFATDRLHREDVRHAPMHRFCQYVATLVETAALHEHRADVQAWLNRLDDEREHVRSALAWSRDAEPETLARICAAMGWYWWIRGMCSEGRRWLADAAGVPSIDVRGGQRIAFARAALALMQQDMDEAVRHATKAATLAADESISQLDRARAANLLGNTYRYTSAQVARRHYERSLDLLRDLDNDVMVSVVLSNLASAAWVEGDLQAARRYATDSVAISRRSGRPYETASALSHLGMVAMDEGSAGEAEAAFREAALILHGFGNRRGLASCLNGLAAVAARRGDDHHALVLTYVADSIRREAGIKRQREWELADQRWMGPVRGRVSDADVHLAKSEAAAVDIITIIDAPQVPASERSRGKVEVLTPREREVVEQVSTGRSNREIALVLGVSGRTVDAHLDHIRTKLGLRTRVQITRWVLDRTQIE
jgi:predicted ATPase/DNA-binding CsgD family transcriptional regulator